MEFIFDATNIAAGNFCIKINCFEPGLIKVLTNTLKKDYSIFEQFFHPLTGWAFYEYFLRFLGVQTEL
jgi:hypothetical protein